MKDCYCELWYAMADVLVWFNIARLPISVARLPISVARLPISVARLPISVARLPISVAKLPISVASQGGLYMYMYVRMYTYV